jgi:hypothetical protein
MNDDLLASLGALALGSDYEYTKLKDTSGSTATAPAGRVAYT